MLQWVRHAWPSHAGKIVGFLSDDPHALDGHRPTLPILGSPDAFEPRPSDGLVLAIGIRGARREVAERLAARGARFLTMIHPTAIVADTAVIGPGSVICPYAVVTDSATLGRCCLANLSTMVAHDAVLGDYSILSPYAGVAGSATVGADAFLSLHSAVGPRVTLGRGVTLAAGAIALHDVPAHSLVHGVPGRLSPLLTADGGEPRGG